ncbi:MAG: hypothetical protein GYA62_04140 [Bacteroidales bacterium]|nr:hypothetical protein [Bacteroidales bacterium]
MNKKEILIIIFGLLYIIIFFIYGIWEIKRKPDIISLEVSPKESWIIERTKVKYNKDWKVIDIQKERKFYIKIVGKNFEKVVEYAPKDFYYLANKKSFIYVYEDKTPRIFKVFKK